MSDTALGKIVIISAVVIVAVTLAMSNFGESNRTRIYDCGMAEWHPDIPAAVKEECRRLRMEERKMQNEQENYKKNLTTT